MDEKKYQTIKAVYARYERWSTQWERDAAYKILMILLKKYNLTLEDIVSQKLEKKERTIWTDRKNSWLVRQVILSLFHEWDIEIFYYTYQKKRYKFQFIINVTDIEYLDIMEAIKFYMDLYEKELWLFNRAFVNKHDLFPIWQKAVPVSKADEKDIMQVMKFMSWMSDANRNQNLKKLVTKSPWVQKSITAPTAVEN